MIAKFRYHSEFSLCNQNSAYSENFALIAKISLSLRKFCYHCKNFAIIEKILLCLRNCHSSTACILHLPSCIMHLRLDEIDKNSYELGITQHNFDAKLDMMVKVYETCKLPKTTLKQNQ